MDYRDRLPPIDYQGTFPRCVGSAFSALAHFCGHKISPQKCYETAKKHDIYPGEDYDGSDLSGGARTIELLGCELNTVHYCNTQALISQLQSSPVVVCVKSELLDIVGSYHAMLVCGHDSGRFLVRNSWGTNWEEKGYKWYPFLNFTESIVGTGYGMRVSRGKSKAKWFLFAGIGVLVTVLCSWLIFK